MLFVKMAQTACPGKISGRLQIEIQCGLPADAAPEPVALAGRKGAALHLQPLRGHGRVENGLAGGGQHGQFTARCGGEISRFQMALWIFKECLYQVCGNRIENGHGRTC